MNLIGWMTADGSMTPYQAWMALIIGIGLLACLGILIWTIYEMW